MDLIDRIKDFASRKSGQLEHLKSEEATKTALVMPFLQMLGYNVFDPTEVVPEFTADVGTKKGEKVDYAIMQDGKPIVLIECKPYGAELNIEYASQLYRYFSVTDARFGILTDGVFYKIYSDLEQPNKMDSKPFLEFNVLQVTPAVVTEIKKFAKEGFDLDRILSTASDLKYTKGIKRVLAEEWINPSEEVVRLFTGRVYSGRFTQSVRAQFSEITKRAFHEFVNDRVNERLKTALESESRSETPAGSDEEGTSEPPTDETPKPGVVTTDEEIEGFYIVKAIVSRVVDARRVFMRDTKSYCGILLDDNNRKPICRLHFGSSKKQVSLFDAAKQETRAALSDVHDLYRYAEQLCETAKGYASE